MILRPVVPARAMVDTAATVELARRLRQDKATWEACLTHFDKRAFSTQLKRARGGMGARHTATPAPRSLARPMHLPTFEPSKLTLIG